MTQDPTQSLPAPQKPLLALPIWLYSSPLSGCPATNAFSPGTAPLTSRWIPQGPGGDLPHSHVCAAASQARAGCRSGALDLPRTSCTEGDTGHGACPCSNRVAGNSGRKAPCQTRVDEQARLVTAVVAEKALRKALITIAGDRSQCPGPCP